MTPRSLATEFDVLAPSVEPSSGAVGSAEAVIVSTFEDLDRLEDGPAFWDAVLSPLAPFEELRWEDFSDVGEGHGGGTKLFPASLEPKSRFLPNVGTGGC